MRPLRPNEPTATRAPSLATRALDDLQYIRSTMERAGERAARFTALPGWGGVLMGVVALIATWTAARSADPRDWVLIWLGAAIVAGLIGATDMIRKMGEERTSLLRGPAWRFVTSLLAPFLVAALMTIVLYRNGKYETLPGLWLISYGAGVVAAGGFSIGAVRAMGAAFMLAGAAAMFTPPAWGDVWMGLGFGGFHILFGLFIARTHRG